MNTTSVSAEAKTRLTEAVKNYTPPTPEKYRALTEVKDSIIALRERKASYEPIRAILHENAGIEVSHQTVARWGEIEVTKSSPLPSVLSALSFRVGREVLPATQSGQRPQVGCAALLSAFGEGV